MSNENQSAELVLGPTEQGPGERVVWMTASGAYIVTSSIDMHTPETIAFRGDHNGQIIDFTELGVAGFGEHEQAIRNAGYNIKENNK